MSEDKPRGQIITSLHVEDENAPVKRRARRKAAAQRRKKIDGWNRNRVKQVLVPRNVTVLSRTGLHASGARIFNCPKCNGKKQIKKVLKPQAGWKLPPGITSRVIVTECYVCHGKGYLWI